MEIRAERPGDEEAIGAVIDAAFAKAEHSDGTEARIVERLRSANALTVTLVATEEEAVIGHVSISPVTINGEHLGWFGLGPVAVSPESQNSGVGARLVYRALGDLRESGAKGCVVLGEPGYYSRFGFSVDPRLVFPGPPAEYFQTLSFDREHPAGTVAYHPAFGA